VNAEAVFRREYGRCVATLIRFLGDIDAAEEAVQDAFTVAAARWPSEGLPPNPGAWIVTTARNRAIDRLRRESVRDERHAQAHHLYGADAPPQEETVPDDRLRLIFTCCHPALNQAAKVALTLRLLGGLQTPEIARAFLVPEATMAQRIVRAKRKIKDTRIPYRVCACVQRDRPGPYQIQAAINAVHSVAPSFDSTDWHAILTLYDQLYALTPTPVVALNRAVALAEVRGPAAGLDALNELRPSGGGLDGYYLFHAARADLLRRLGRDEEAAAAYHAARALTANPVEQAFLDAQRTAVSGPPAAPHCAPPRPRIPSK
jgi:RNA polymerase sigma factor (sigma-70 family)